MAVPLPAAARRVLAATISHVQVAKIAMSLVDPTLPIVNEPISLTTEVNLPFSSSLRKIKDSQVGIVHCAAVES